MNRKQIYTLLSVITIIAFYFLNDKVDESIADDNYQEKANPAIETNTTYLPTSTTGYIVHHDYYSLSYNEHHEQAEWVAYELKKSHLSKNSYKRPYFIRDKSIKTKSADWRSYKK